MLITMCRLLRSVRSICVITGFAAVGLVACTGSEIGGQSGTGGTSATAKGGSSGGAGSGGSAGPGLGGTVGTAGATGSSGSPGTTGAGGRGGATGSAGATGAGGRIGAGGRTGAGGAAGTTGAGGSSVNCSGTLPAGGTAHTSSNAQGTAAGLNWSVWTNASAGTITTYTVPAFSASWNNSGDFLARLGLEWGNSGKTFDQFGTIAAQFAETKSGTGGGYSYIGIYGWSMNPCIEFYIVDDSYNRMPVNPGTTTNKGTATIDGGTYTLYTRPTSGTGGSRCSGVSSWTQFYSVRQTARQCGQISITEHFKAWAAAGMTLGSMLEAKILVEVGGGVGSIDFTTASVTAQ
jgi:endo-1,4-beta-xylanase